MNGIKIPIGQRPNYYYGQLLLAKDFLDEQSYHINARRSQNKLLYDWGVVRGLAIARAQDKSVRIAAGAAIDVSGNEIRLDESTVVDLSAFRPRDRIHIGLVYEESSDQTGGGDTNRVDCYAIVTVAQESDPRSGLVLGVVPLDDQGNVNEPAIDYTPTRYARLAAGSITAVQLHDDLRRGWLRLPFRPAPMVEGPEAGVEAGLPAFRVGATEALSPGHKDDPRDPGAAGTMAIPIPPNAKHITRFRIAGMENKGEISLLLMRGGWDPATRKHVRDILIDKKIDRQEPFEAIYDVEEKNTALAEYHTLALWLKGTRRTAISLVAVEFVY